MYNTVRQMTSEETKRQEGIPWIRHKIKRINELYRKSKAEGLTDAERREQKILRQEYLELVKRNLRSQLNNIDIEEKDGTVVNLGEKYGSQEGN